MQKKQKIRTIIAVVLICIAVALCSVGGMLTITNFKQVGCWLCLGALPFVITGAILLIMKD